ncbi:DUF2812 domain-containing protein [Sporosarcina sp. YIM B06819]|uniref:DUF2812 domain-containing protein n=1 Tax=Sporosarcina sp. YIM B06819 TaxID=3081769 RepID=UPI00298C3FC5|nr:DUF2812 domain-containing protein [Sporosarcina sp. YIM B06819]
MMKKFRLFIDSRKEEKWLNKMIEKGWICKKVNAFGIYYFEKTKMLKQVIRLDSQSFKSIEIYEQYIQLHEDFGWHHIGGSRWSLSQYWTKPTDGLDELFSDDASEKSYLQRLMKYYGNFTLFFMFFTFILFNNSSPYTSLKSAYFTPGLWNRKGIEFLTAFLIETPLALARFSTPWLFVIGGIACALMYLRYKNELEKTT